MAINLKKSVYTQHILCHMKSKTTVIYFLSNLQLTNMSRILVKNIPEDLLTLAPDVLACPVLASEKTYQWHITNNII